MYRELLLKSEKNRFAGMYPVDKIAILVMYIAIVVMANIVLIDGISLLLIPLSLGIYILFVLSGMPMQFFKFLNAVKFLLILLFIVQAFLLKGSDPVLLWRWGFLTVYREGLQRGITLAFNVLNIAGVFYWLFNTSTYQQIATALEQSGFSHRAAYIFISTFKMIDVLSENSKRIMNAQRARGVETEGNIFVRAKALIPVIIPLIVNAILAVGERGITLESKGFSLKCDKSILIPVRKNGLESVALVVMGTLTACAIGGVVAWAMML
jgi:energy-coupling factor transporter transmembrane protein EcfT